MRKQHSRYAVARGILIFWGLFIGVGAVAGSVGMLIAPDGSAMGMQEILPYFQVLPFAEQLFQNFVFPGIALLVVNGATNLTAAALLLARKRAGVALGGFFGVTLMLWITIQFVIFPRNILSISYFIFGFAQAATGYAAWVFDRQERFHTDAAQYPDIGTKKGTLVAYFSRMGYVQRIAYETAQRYGADLYRIVATEPTQGTLGFWWCGRFGMHHWKMPIEEVRIDWDKYDTVVICAPVWVFALAAPVRSFCAQARGKIRRAEYILVHFQHCDYRNVVREMDALLAIRHDAARSICCRQGRYLRDRAL